MKLRKTSLCQLKLRLNPFLWGCGLSPGGAAKKRSVHGSCHQQIFLFTPQLADVETDIRTWISDGKQILGGPLLEGYI